MYNVLECDLTQFGLHGLDCILSARWMTEMLKKEGEKKTSTIYFLFFLTGQLIATINQQHQNSNLHLFLMLAFLFP